jgi:hypothetical protein
MENCIKVKMWKMENKDFFFGFIHSVCEEMDNILF